MAILEVERLEKRFGSTDVLKDISGQVVNHCLGKSETFKDVVGHLVLIEIVIHLLFCFIRFYSVAT